MTIEERKPTGLLHSADELKQLIAENPDLPIVVFAGDDANTGDYTYMSCNYVSATKGEFLDCDQQIDECCNSERGGLEMTESDYKYLQERLSKKSENNPYKHTGCTNYETGYKEGIAAAKSILSEFYHRMEDLK